MISPAQARAARAALKWKVTDLAARSHLSPNTVMRAEADKGVQTSTLALMQQALEAAGVRFTGDGGVVPPA